MNKTDRETHKTNRKAGETILSWFRSTRNLEQRARNYLGNGGAHCAGFRYLTHFPNLGLLCCVQSFSSVWLTRRPTLCCWLVLMFHAKLAPVETYFAWIILSVHFRKSLFQWNELHFSDYATTIPHLLPGRCRQGGPSVQFNNPCWPKLFVIIIIRNWVLESNWAQWNLYEKESILSPMQ